MHLLVDGEPVSIDGGAMGVGEVAAGAVELTADVPKLQASSYANAEARACCFGAPDAHSTVETHDTASVAIASGATITGSEGVGVLARLDDVETSSLARAKTSRRAG